jgi:hypothetical protein
MGADSMANELGVRPVRSVAGPIEMSPETGLHATYREWARLMQAGLEGRKPYA